MPRYECDRCGACCGGTLMVFAELLDVVREPRLLQADPHYAGRPLLDVLSELEEPGKAVGLAIGRPCAFLGPDGCCSIYPTRPNDCVAMPAGDEECQQARERAGLPALLPVPGS